MLMNNNKGMTVQFTRSQISEGVRRIAEEIRKDYSGQSLTMVYVLKGSGMFFSDLCRELQDLSLIMEFINPEFHRDVWGRPTFKEFICGRQEDYHGKPVIILTEMLDSVRFMNAVIERVARKEPLSISIAALLIKSDVQISQLSRKTYYAFEAAHPVVGYGIDPSNVWQGLPEIYTKC